MSGHGALKFLNTVDASNWSPCCPVTEGETKCSRSANRPLPELEVGDNLAQAKKTSAARSKPKWVKFFMATEENCCL
jgi:hypothetical protein